MDEKTLVAKAQAGDREVLGELLMAHQRACYALALRLTGGPADAEDVCQDAFVRATRDVAAYSGTGSFRSWLFTLVVNSHRNRRGSDEARRRRERSHAMAARTVEAPGTTPPERNELRRCLDDSMGRLEEDYRLPLTLHYEQGLSHSEAAAVLAIPEGTVKTNIRRGIEELRTMLARAGYGALALGAVEGALSQAPVISVPASFAAFIKSLAATGGLPAVASAKAGGLTLGWKLVAGLSLAAFAGFGGLQMWNRNSRAELPATAPEITPVPQVLTVTPRGSSAWAAFEDLRAKDLRIVMMTASDSTAYQETLVVPTRLRFTPVEGRKLAEAVAEARGLRVAWSREGTMGVLQRGASDAEVAAVLIDLRAGDAARRQEAAWKAQGKDDTRLISSLVRAASDPDPEVSRLARRALLGVGWAAVLATEYDNDLAWKLMKEEYVSGQFVHGDSRRAIVLAIGQVGSERGLETLESALMADDRVLQFYARKALGQIGGERALALLKKAPDEDGALEALARLDADFALASIEGRLKDPLRQNRQKAARQLDRIGGDKALALAERILDGDDVQVCRGAILALGRVGGDKALALIETVLRRNDDALRAEAITALGGIGGEKARALVNAALKHRDERIRIAAIRALAEFGDGDAADALLQILADDRESAAVRTSVEQSFARFAPDVVLAITEKVPRPLGGALRNTLGGEASLPLLRKFLQSDDSRVRADALFAFGPFKSDEALAQLQGTLGDKNEEVRRNALYSLAGMQREKATSLVLAALQDKAPSSRRAATSVLSEMGSREARDALLKRLEVEKDANVRTSIWSALGNGFRGDPLVEKVLKSSGPPVKPRPQPRPKPAPAPPETF